MRYVSFTSCRSRFAWTRLNYVWFMNELHVSFLGHHLLILYTFGSNIQKVGSHSSVSFTLEVIIWLHLSTFMRHWSVLFRVPYWYLASFHSFRLATCHSLPSWLILILLPGWRFSVLIWSVSKIKTKAMSILLPFQWSFCVINHWEVLSMWLWLVSKSRI